MGDRTANLAALVRYFRDCLLADGGERRLDDAFATGELGHYLQARPTPFDAQDVLPLPEAKGRELARSAQVQRQERELLLGWRFICGRHPDRPERGLRTPLYLADARVHATDAGFVATAIPGSLRINPAALAALGLSRDAAIEPDDEDPRWLALLTAFEALPELTLKADADRLPALRRPVLQRAEVVVLWLSQRGRVAASTAYELEAMARSGAFSPAVAALLRHPGPVTESAPAASPRSVPARLSRAQEQAVLNAAQHTLSVVYGAPGTGKTYTIAGITADRVIRGERVLIVCGNEHAADVVFDRLADAFAFGDSGHLVVRAGHGAYHQRMLQELDTLLTRPPPASPTDPQHAPDMAADTAEAALARGAHRQRALADALAQALRRAHDAGPSLRTAGGTPIDRLRRRWLRWRLPRTPLLADRWHAHRDQIRAHQDQARDVLHLRTRAARHRLLSTQRQKLADLSVALRSRHSGHRTRRMAALDWSVLTRTFPVWVTSAASLDRALPLIDGLFDLVIVDEATQCNVALALPALQRARRAVIVGDPKQLRHFSFLSRQRQAQFAEAHGVVSLPVSLEYRTHSLLDYAMHALPSSDAQVWLDEHFRSHPELIDFSNHRFYEGRLKILTDTRRIADAPPRRLIACPVTLDDGINRAEVDALIGQLHELINTEAALPAGEASSIGVVALFSALARTLQDRIQREFGLEALSRHDVLVATPYGFQGEERDVILLATGVHPNTPSAARRYIERPDVFNVAVTRARHRQIVFIAQDAMPEKDDGLLGAYLGFHGEPPLPNRTVGAAHCDTRQTIITTLEAHGYRCWPDFGLGGQIIDLLVIAGKRALAIDLVGTASATGAPWSLDRYTLLERTGLELLPIALHEWRWQRDAVLAKITQILGAEGCLGQGDAWVGTTHLRWQFERLGQHDFAHLLEQLDHILSSAQTWLGRRFSPTELTYQRYMQSLQTLMDDTLAELDAVRLLIAEHGALAVDPALIKARTTRALAQGQRTRQALETLAQRLALDDAWDHTRHDESLADLARLTDQLTHYQPTIAEPTDTPHHPA